MSREQTLFIQGYTFTFFNWKSPGNVTFTFHSLNVNLRLRSLTAGVVVDEVGSSPRQLALMETGANYDLVKKKLKKIIFQSFFDRPACADGSRPQKPKEEGSPPQCDDGDTPVCILWIVLSVS